MGVRTEEDGFMSRRSQSETAHKSITSPQLPGHLGPAEFGGKPVQVSQTFPFTHSYNSLNN